MLSNERFKGFNRSNPRLEGTHAFLSPSNYHWLNYPEDKLIERLKNNDAAARGTRLHDLAARSINEGVMMAETGEHVALALHVNHAIQFGMLAEQTLFYSLNCYGTADAIGFDAEENFLRIHDFKSGVAPTSEKQLYVYAGLFCHEYGFKPYEIEGELRIYQAPNDVREYEMDRGYLAFVYEKIYSFNEIIELVRQGELA